MVTIELDVILKGQFTTIDVFVEGHEIPLKEREDNVWSRHYDEFEVKGVLDVKGLLKGWTNRAWSLEIKSNGTRAYFQEGTFDHSGVATFNNSTT